MAIENIAETAEQFLSDYLQERHFFTPDEELDAYDASTARVGFFRAVPHPNQPGTILYTFLYGRELSKGDEELEERVQECMDALMQAHPELSQYKVSIDYMKSR